MPGSRRATAVGLAILATLLAWGCAKKAAPGGGPPDLVPPRVIDSAPDSGTARVPLDTELSVTFSEGMEPRSTGEGIALAPYVEIRRRHWRGRTITLELAQSLRADQIYTLFVGAHGRDRHGNALAKGTAIVFSTGDSFPPGRIQGEVVAKGFSGPGTYLWCYDAAHPGPDSTARDFDALGQADPTGKFQVDGLRVPGRYRLWAFADLNGNRSFEPASDILAPVDSTFALTAGHPVASGLVVTVVNPRAPARIKGTVIDSITVLKGALRVVAVSEKDSTRQVIAETGTANAFDLQLEAGRWAVRAFRDVDGSKSWQPETEPASPPLGIDVGPADEVVDIKLVIEPASGGAKGP